MRETITNDRWREEEVLTDSAKSEALKDDPRVIEAVQKYLAALEAGEKPDRAAFLERYADLAGAIAGCLDALEFVHAAGPELSGPGDERMAPAAAPEASLTYAKPLGDFRILREIGRGGMGVVYEAEQLSLGRRIALKVLPFAAAMDHKHLQRFKNEAQAAAHLHHSNIVPVHAVGCERGVHYYAMQFIEGEPLSNLIRALREQRDGKKEAALPTTAYERRAQSAEREEPRAERQEPRAEAPLSPSPLAGEGQGGGAVPSASLLQTSPTP